MTDATSGQQQVIDELGAWRPRAEKWARRFNAGPAWMYRLRLGFLMPQSLVMITHRGRKSGRMRYTCLEVAHRDQATGEVVVFSSRGQRANWYRNLAAAPAVAVQVGRRRFQPEQRVLPSDEVLAVLREYLARRPAVAKRLAPNGTDEELRLVAERARMVAFRDRAIQ